jgi:hypothetical protein
VLNGLGPEFNSFVVVVTIIATSCTDPLHFTDIHGLLLSHEALLTAQTPQTSLPSFSSPTAFYTRSTHPNKYNPRPNTYRHPKPFPPPQTPKSPSYQYQPQPTASKFVCQICSKPVHSVKICHWRYDIPNLSPYQAFTAQSSSVNPPSTEWVPDSGATNHVTNDINNLSSFYEYAGPDNLQTGSETGPPFNTSVLALNP